MCNYYKQITKSEYLTFKKVKYRGYAIGISKSTRFMTQDIKWLIILTIINYI